MNFNYAVVVPGICETPGYQVIGDTSGVVNFNLAPGQKVLAEPGAFLYSSDGIKPKTTLGSITGAISRSLSGESPVKVTWENTTSQPGYVGVGCNFPATIIPLNMAEFKDGVKCSRDAFVATTDVNASITPSILRAAGCLACCCSGAQWVQQSIRTTQDDAVFVAAFGTIIRIELGQGESVVCDSGTLVASSASVTIDVKCSGGCLTCCCGGEGIMNTELVGPGVVFLSSLPMAKMRALMLRYHPQYNK